MKHTNVLNRVDLSKHSYWWIKKNVLV